jgi:hypothetical protein
VIKKLKQINEEQKESLLEELRVVNLSKFVSEAVAAILDAKLKSSDINAAVQVPLFCYRMWHLCLVVRKAKIQGFIFFCNCQEWQMMAKTQNFPVCSRINALS